MREVRGYLIVIISVLLVSGISNSNELPRDEELLTGVLPMAKSTNSDEKADKKINISPGKLDKSASSLFKTEQGTPFAELKGKSSISKEFAISFSLKKLFGDTKPAGGGENCLVCHKGIEIISEDHNFKCVECHQGNSMSKKITEAHNGLVPNPSELGFADKYCGECHKDQIERVSTSIMATAAGEINSTRFQWGAQKSVDAIYGVKGIGKLTKFPAFDDSKEPVDDMLKTKCLRCHIDGVAPNRKGDFRAAGCASCHMIYSNDGISKSPDMAIQGIQELRRSKTQGIINEKRGYPVKHVFTTAIPSSQCVRCHSGNRIGTEYIGLFEHNSDIKENPVLKTGESNLIYGANQHKLMPDIHYEKGLHCIDCHTRNEIEGDGKIYGAKHSAVKIRCEDCHGLPESMPSTTYLSVDDYELKTSKSNTNYDPMVGDKVVLTNAGVKLSNVRIRGDEFILTSKVTGKEHIIPLLHMLKPQPVSHKIPEHIKKVECHACHSAWTSNDWGYNVTQNEELIDKKKWWFTDPYIQNLQFLSPKIENNIVKNAVWWDFFARRTWENMLGIINERGKVSAARPEFQWVINVGSKGYNKKVTFINPYVPHTQRKQARKCEECHMNRYFVGLGDRPIAFGKTSNLTLSTSSKKARLFNEGEIEKLLNKSKKYKFYRYIDLKKRGWKNFFDN